ncbi:LacI family transcriptional regulator [Corynebacterium sp. TA-R-1]|uniref:LacI family transcriptional regulator n=1 Tax=Corynebacterium stercoris TaxID=2943490 RepID=A0ABT1FYF5_9CORY|nr:LacI family DNA-binding transcriptional regulator [Corynebacterium stercoris]MCP1386802.1 LacI family transcriptional regulator [Corynebacterium stercoris]
MSNPRSRTVRVTMDDVARAAGVSRATVSRVMTGNSSVSKETFERVNAAITALGYVPNAAAQSLAGRRHDTPMVGLLLRDPSSAYYGYFHSQMQRQSEDHGFQLVAAAPTVRGNLVDELSALERLVRLGVNGIFLATGSIRPSDVESLLDTVPMISVGRPELHDEITAISYDEETHGEIMATNVVNHGHQAVCVVNTPMEVSSSESHRAQAMIRSLKSAGVVVEVVEAAEAAQRMSTIQPVLKLLKDGRVTCVMFPADYRALQFVDYCTMAGLKIPEAVSVTGVDGIIPRWQNVGLATLRLPVEGVAARAAQVMGSRLENPRQPVTHETLVGTFMPGHTLATAHDFSGGVG